MRTLRAVATRAIGTAALAAIATACASTGAVPKPFPTPGSGAPRGSPDASSPAPHLVFDGYALAGSALALRGAPYRDGGSDPAGFDCSGFTQYVFAQYGVSLPRAVRDQYRSGKSVKPENLEAGDLVFFTTTEPGASHVAIAIGGDEFVHAPSSAGIVRVEHLSSNYWAPRFVGARGVN